MAERSLQLDIFRQQDASTAFAVRESARARRMSIRVTPWRGVEIVVPRRTRPADVEAFVHAHRQWIEKTSHELARTAPPIDLSPPSSIALRAVGRNYDVHYGKHSRSGHAVLRASGQVLNVTGASDDDKAIAKLRQWLRDTARRLLPVVLDEVAGMTGLDYRRIQVRGQRTRWGSCSSNGTISLNYCLLFLAPDEMRYLMVHELCHTRHMNHSRRFWSLVSTHVADHRHYERRLDQAWRAIPGWVGLH